MLKVIKKEDSTISRLVKPNDSAMRDKNVLLISDDNEKLGVVPIREAFEKAAEAGLDVVAVSEKGDTPVCRLMDYGKYRYEQKQKRKNQKKNQHVQKNKEIKFHVNTDTHDYELKLKHILEFLEKGYNVRISLFFRGREMAHRELGVERVKQVIEDIGDKAQVDSPPKLAGRMVSAHLSPQSKNSLRIHH